MKRDLIATAAAGVAGIFGSLTLPELAACVAGFGTGLAMVIQAICAIRKDRREARGRGRRSA